MLNILTFIISVFYGFVKCLLGSKYCRSHKKRGYRYW